ncbi:olfactory receptor 6X1-like [Python bivittatus]|uniref:Olfactory receptor n=1 Tax=Python bivittatus TaxID=176946 RepID=A0A9F2RFC0_PYTBI|nr:olfactory receptor 6X1-like [Python bivittatus]
MSPEYAMVSVFTLNSMEKRMGKKKNMNLTNCTRVTAFILVGLPRVRGMEGVMHAGIFVLYLLCLMGNGLIILSNLSLIDIGHTTVFVPKLLVNYVSAKDSICFACCLSQSFFYFLFGITEFFIITLISLDRYIAICHPLRYATIMTPGVCLKLAIASWFGGFFCLLYSTMKLPNLPFCPSNIINHFFCDAGPLLKVAGGYIQVIEALVFLITVFVIMSSLLFTLISYLFIISTILRIPSSSRQQRAFSTCASHLIVVTILYSSVFFVYLRPTVKSSSFSKMKSVSLVSAIVVPVLNPFIYTIRNHEVKEAVWKALRKETPGFPKI